MDKRMVSSAVAAVVMAAIIVDYAMADDKSDAYVAVEQWASAFNAGDVSKVAAAYAPSALLFGTASPVLTSNADDVVAYFKGAIGAKTQVKLGEYLATSLTPGSVAISGFYEFSRPGSDGQSVSLPSRYSFVLMKQDAGWLIANHHSSLMPRPPAPAK